MIVATVPVMFHVKASRAILLSGLGEAVRPLKIELIVPSLPHTGPVGISFRPLEASA